MKQSWGRPGLHDDWTSVEDEVGKTSLKVLFGFWLTIVAFAGGFWTLMDFSVFG